MTTHALSTLNLMTDSNPTECEAPVDPESPDYEALARQYLDLWQDQFTAMAADPGTMETLSKMTEAWREATFAFLQGPGSPSAFGDMAESFGIKGVPNDAGNEPRHEGKTGSATGAKATDGSSGGADGDVDALLRRITDLETRLAALEHGAKQSPKSKKRAKSGKSKKRTGN